MVVKYLICACLLVAIDLVSWHEHLHKSFEHDQAGMEPWILPDFQLNIEEGILSDTRLHNEYSKASNKDRLGRYFRICNETLVWPFEEIFTWKDGSCIRDNLHFNRPIEILGYFLLFSVVVFSNICGVGGGYLTVIILYEIFGFESRKTYGYAAFFNFLAALVRYLYYFRRRHPFKSFHTLIDYEMVLILMPLGIIGMIVGNMVYSVLPMIAIAVMLAVFWSIFAIDIFVRGIKMYRHEKAQNVIEFQRKLARDKKSTTKLDSYEIVHNNSRTLLERHPKDDPRSYSVNSIGANTIPSPSKEKNNTEQYLTISNPNSNYGNKLSANEDKESKNSSSTGRSELISFALTQMRYMDTDEESEAEENKLLMSKIRKSAKSYHQATNDLTKASSEEEIKQLQELIETKLRRKNEKWQIELKKIQISEGRHFGTKTCFIFMNFCIALSNYLFRGATQKSVVGVTEWSTADWLAFIGVGTVAFILALATISFLRTRYINKRRAGYAIHISDIHWNYQEGTRLHFISFVWGTLTGILGLGEGTAYVPLLISLGKHPYVASATGMKISMMLSWWVATIYAIEGFFDDYYFIFIGGILTIAALIGIIIGDKLFNWLQKPSYMLFFLTLNLIAVAATLPHQVINRRFQNGSSRTSYLSFGTFWEYGSGDT